MTDHERPSNQQSGISPEHMPPLEPTAEVPAIHSDKMNTPEYWNEKYDAKPAKVPVEHRDAPKKPGMGKKLIAGIAGAAVLGGGAFAGVKMLSDSDRSVPPQSNSATENKIDSQPEVIFELPSIEEFDYTLAADDYAGNSKQLVLDFFDKRNTWANDLANRGGKWIDKAKSFLDDRDRGIEISEMTSILLEPSNEAFIRDTVRPDWQSTEGDLLTAQMNRWIENTQIQSEYALQTTGWLYDEDIEPFKRSIIADADSVEILSESPDTITARVYLYTIDNTDKNRGEDIIKNYIPPEEHATAYATVTFKRFGDNMKLYGFDVDA